MSKPLTLPALTVLRMLCDGPMHPYEMQQRIRVCHYDAAVKITPGSLYHTVDRLTAAALIEPLETSREGRRPERTVYAVTTAGRDAAHNRLAELFAKPTEEFPPLGTALAFANLFPPTRSPGCCAAAPCTWRRRTRACRPPTTRCARTASNATSCSTRNSRSRGRAPNSTTSARSSTTWSRAG